MIKKINIHSEFNRNVLKLLSGTVLGNVVAFIALPILTRLYTKQALGDLQLFLSTVTTFGVISALKYELAIVLPKDKKAGNYLIILSLLVLLLFSLAISFLFLFWGAHFLKLLNAEFLQPYIYFIFLGIFLMGLMQTLQYVLVRVKKFGELARNKVIQMVTTQILAISLGLFYPSFISLFIAQLAGFLVASLLVLSRGYFHCNDFQFRELVRYAIQYKKFPLINTSMVFLNTLSLQLPVFMFKKYFSSEVVGLYMVSNRLINIPLSLLGRSMSQVYFQSASEAYQDNPNKLMSLYKETLKKLILLVTPFIGLILLFAPFFVELFLGKEWREAGIFMQIMTFWIFFQFLNLPISTTFTIVNKQEIGFILIIISLITRFLAMYYFRENYFQMLYALSISAGIFYFLFNYFIYLSVKKILKK